MLTGVGVNKTTSGAHVLEHQAGSGLPAPQTVAESISKVSSSLKLIGMEDNCEMCIAQPFAPAPWHAVCNDPATCLKIRLPRFGKF